MCCRCRSALGTALGTAADASALLGITVESAPTIEAITVRTIVYAPPAPPPAAVSSGLSNGAIAGIIVGVTAVGIARSVVGPGGARCVAGTGSAASLRRAAATSTERGRRALASSPVCRND